MPTQLLPPRSTETARTSHSSPMTVRPERAKPSAHLAQVGATERTNRNALTAFGRFHRCVQRQVAKPPRSAVPPHIRAKAQLLTVGRTDASRAAGALRLRVSDLRTQMVAWRQWDALILVGPPAFFPAGRSSRAWTAPAAPVSSVSIPAWVRDSCRGTGQRGASRNRRPRRTPSGWQDPTT